MENKCGSTKLVDVHKLIPNPKNNNEHDQDQIEWLAKIIDYQGIRKPIIVSNQSGFMITGHCTLEAIKYNGGDKAPVSFQDFKNEAQEYAHMTADNEIARKAHFNASKAIEDIKLLSIDDISLLGLGDDEIRFIDIEEINRGDEHSEWVGMPDFKEGENYIKLTYIFSSNETRNDFIEENSIKVDMKRNDANWICYK